ncbi:MAG: fasciclin domain-containing protein [Salinarimonas sp.]
MRFLKTMTAATAALLMTVSVSKAQDIVDVAIAADDFTTLVAAVDAAGLVETLKGEGPFTVFAPTDAAFAALPEGTVETLLQPENRDQLVAILTYHVIPGAVMSSDIAGQEVMPETVQGSTLSIDATGDAVMVNNATVVTADVEATNGVIHIIDTVLIPE